MAGGLPVGGDGRRAAAVREQAGMPDLGRAAAVREQAGSRAGGGGQGTGRMSSQGLMAMGGGDPRPGVLVAVPRWSLHLLYRYRDSRDGESNGRRLSTRETSSQRRILESWRVTA
jgi:hypothetical protein